MAQIYYSPFIPAFSSNGAPVPGAKLYFYYTLTSTPAPVYADSGLSTPLTNPVEADGSGKYPPIYLNEAVTYRVVQTDGDDAQLGDAIDPYVPGQALKGEKGDPGAADNVAANLSQLRAAPTTNYTMIYDGSLFAWTLGNFTGRVDDLTVIKADSTALSIGAWVRQDLGFGFQAKVAVGVETNQAPTINAALATTSKVILPSGVIWIGQSVVVPANTTLVMQDDTVLKALPAFASVGGNNSGIVLAGNRAAVHGGAVDMNGVGSSPSNRFNGVTVNSGCRDCVRLNLEVSNCTGYAVWDAGANTLTAPPSSYNENVRTFNSQVHFEPQASDGTVYLNCHARDGAGTIPCFSYFHPLAGSRNIKYIACTAYGAASAGVDLNSNIDKLREIHLIDCDVETTGAVTALSHPTGFLGVESLRVIGGRYKSGGIGVSLVDTNATMIGVKMEGANGFESTNSNIYCTGCEAIGSRDPAGGAAAFGAVGLGSGQVRFNGGLLTATGPVGSEPYTGNVRVSEDTNLIPVPSAPPFLTKRAEYQAQLTPVSDGASCYANFAVPLNPADLAKITVNVTTRSIGAGTYTTSAYGPGWQFLTGNQFRARISGNNLDPATYSIDVHYVEFE